MVQQPKKLSCLVGYSIVYVIHSTATELVYLNQILQKLPLRSTHGPLFLFFNLENNSFNILTFLAAIEILRGMSLTECEARSIFMAN